MQGLLTDLVVAKRYFAFWLPDMCNKSSDSYQLYNQIVSGAKDAGTLLSVMGKPNSSCHIISPDVLHG